MIAVATKRESPASRRARAAEPKRPSADARKFGAWLRRLRGEKPIEAVVAEAAKLNDLVVFHGSFLKDWEAGRFDSFGLAQLGMAAWVYSVHFLTVLGSMPLWLQGRMIDELQIWSRGLLTKDALRRHGGGLLGVDAGAHNDWREQVEKFRDKSLGLGDFDLAGVLVFTKPDEYMSMEGIAQVDLVGRPGLLEKLVAAFQRADEWLPRVLDCFGQEDESDGGGAAAGEAN